MIIKKAWDFYIELFSHENMAVRVATFTATITAITFLLNFIFKPFWGQMKRRLSKIHVDTTVHQRFIQNYVGFTIGDPILTVVVTNRSESVKYSSHQYKNFPQNRWRCNMVDSGARKSNI